jgi:Coenzyme PQQ synthesis protein D (PqqD)
MICRVPGLTLETIIARRSEPLTAPVDGDLVMLDPRHGRYFGLDEIGNRIWELLERPQSVKALCSTLEAQFDVAPETCRADVVTFLEQLAEAELVETR